jgi:hypothetical protein
LLVGHFLPGIIHALLHSFHHCFFFLHALLNRLLRFLRSIGGLLFVAASRDSESYRQRQINPTRRFSWFTSA